MSRQTIIGGVLAALAAALVLVLWPGPEETPEDQIRQTVIQMAAAAEEKDVGAVMEHIAEGFRGTSQNMTREDLRRVLAAQILRGTWVRVFIVSMDDPELTSPTTARFRGRFIFGRSTADTLEELAARTDIDHYEVEGELEKGEDGQWRFVTGGYRVVRADVPSGP